MNFSKKELKKKILYRSSYRGTKEMDFLMTSFTNEYIDSLDDNDLVDLSNLLNLEDEKLYSLNREKKITKDIPNNKVTNLFISFKLKK
tara:strand:- start:46 stop:309 length:264 start_codon:yes stop_codon:yes gene_type:complete